MARVSFQLAMGRVQLLEVILQSSMVCIGKKLNQQLELGIEPLVLWHGMQVA